MICLFGNNESINHNEPRLSYTFIAALGYMLLRLPSFTGMCIPAHPCMYLLLLKTCPLLGHAMTCSRTKHAWKFWACVSDLQTALARGSAEYSRSLLKTFIMFGPMHDKAGVDGTCGQGQERTLACCVAAAMLAMLTGTPGPMVEDTAARMK